MCDFESSAKTIVIVSPEGTMDVQPKSSLGNVRLSSVDGTVVTSELKSYTGSIYTPKTGISVFAHLLLQSHLHRRYSYTLEEIERTLWTRTLISSPMLLR